MQVENLCRVYSRRKRKMWRDDDLIKQVSLYISRSARPRAASPNRRDPAVLPEHIKNVHSKPAQRFGSLLCHLRENARGSHWTADTRDTELEHVHLPEVEEQETAAVPRRDLGCGRCGEYAKYDVGQCCRESGALALPPSSPTRIVRPWLLINDDYRDIARELQPYDELIYA